MWQKNEWVLFSFIAFTTSCNLFSYHKSSESKKAIHSELALIIPIFLADPGPLWVPLINLILASWLFIIISDTILQLLSVEPSSIIKISNGLNVWFIIELILSLIKSSEL